MLRTLKDTRRRVVETVMEKAGASERTEDPGYDLHVANFNTMVKDLNECGAALTSVLELQKRYFSDATELSRVFDRVYGRNMDPEHWPTGGNALTLGQAAGAYVDAMSYIHETIRSSSAMACNELALEPLKASILRMAPAIEASCERREAAVKDFDSYRRRLKGLETKRDAAVKDALPEPKLSEIVAEVNKFQAKLVKSEEEYNATNSQTKGDIISAKLAHDHLLDFVFICTIVCQDELFSQASQRLNEILTRFPPEKVQQVRSRMATYVKQGGVSLTKEKSTLEKGLDIASGKALPSEYMKSKDAIEAEDAAKAAEEERMRRVVQEEERAREQARNVVAQQQHSVARDTTSPAGKSSNVKLSIPTAKVVAPPVPAAAVVAQPPPPPPGSTKSKRLFVTAIFDHEAEEDDELAFNVGDVVEVLDSSDEGWWKGTVAGRVGIFPVNYVEIKK